MAPEWLTMHRISMRPRGCHGHTAGVAAAQPARTVVADISQRRQDLQSGLSDEVACVTGQIIKIRGGYSLPQ
jgi:hypothetical protein